MTEEIEQKLNELLGMRKQLEELTTEKRKSEALASFEEKKKIIRHLYWIFFVISCGFLFYGLTGLYMNTGKYQIISLFFAVLGYETSVLLKLWYHTTQSRLLILEEMKQFELRMTEMLAKQAGSR